ncbi:hypothetical protein WNY79_03315 [Pseudoalteromonas sp. AS84]|uniref:hypothetical protein n=1 Tax=unclassified Pseudoalteromonas TaxID=194690 RepID=UPI0015FD444E|nr:MULTISPECIES: hypothetical protein [unclassified Pseudoalteromonas]MBB1307466.1 hypothetical protein [Pseudoalteromonas sp. SR43-5]MBB1324859.1 hypothetical protein [Pseudoalteromonas sp. SR45-1]MBB1456476.1 hypothetical protein [Pseudoalteromonas sp. SG43-5]
MNGLCALCRKSAKLKDSHFMPKAIYRSISKGFPEHGQNIVLINGSDKSAAYTDKQAKKHLLCESCELKFSKNGEEKVISFMARPNGFKLATKIKKFKALSHVQDERWYFPSNDKIALNFMYFAVSIAWRLSVTDWSGYGIPDTKNSIREESMVAFSDYLLGNTEFPANTYLAVYVDNQIVDKPTMGFPTVKNHDGYQHIVFNIPGLKFSLLAGNNPGADIRETFSINTTNVYFVSRSLKTHPDYHFMVNFLKNESVAKGRLLKERSKNV